MPVFLFMADDVPFSISPEISSEADLNPLSDLARMWVLKASKSINMPSTWMWRHA